MREREFVCVGGVKANAFRGESATAAAAEPDASPPSTLPYSDCGKVDHAASERGVRRYGYEQPGALFKHDLAADAVCVNKNLS